MIDFGFDKLALIGAVALVVIGPQRLPRVARTVGHLLGKAQRYVSDVKAEVNRSMELDELRKMKDTVTGAAKDIESIMAAYDRRLDCLGIGEAAFQRSDGESGKALMIRREGLQRMQKESESMFRQSDESYIKKCVACMRIFGDGPNESAKYQIEYATAQGGSAEAQETREQEKHDLDIQIETPASILAGRMGIEVEAAQKILTERFKAQAG